MAHVTPFNQVSFKSGLFLINPANKQTGNILALEKDIKPFGTGLLGKPKKFGNHWFILSLNYSSDPDFLANGCMPRTVYF